MKRNAGVSDGKHVVVIAPPQCVKAVGRAAAHLSPCFAIVAKEGALLAHCPDIVLVVAPNAAEPVRQATFHLGPFLTILLNDRSTFTNGKGPNTVFDPCAAPQTVEMS